MRKAVLWNDNWTFTIPDAETVEVALPHTWNGIDGHDGGNDYLRTACKYTKRFARPETGPGGIAVLQFRGVNSECEVFLNGEMLCSHEGGYSTFNVDITKGLKDDNLLEVFVANIKNDRVYPQKADFTFYGGIYRDVYLITLPADRFEYGPFSSGPLKVKAEVRGDTGVLTAESALAGKGGVRVTVFADGKQVAQGVLSAPIEIENVRLWDGLNDPFLYTVKAELTADGRVTDEVSVRIGFRTFNADPAKGFYLNGKPYPLRGVCRHQDRPKAGNAISRADHDEDIALIAEVGANTVRLAHYQHDQYFYDLCDERGIIVWTEIPYISKHMPNANENAYSQMRELISQNYNHPSIVCWGISNEITISRIGKDTVDCHKKLHEICHEEDPGRLTVVACYMAVFKGNPTAHVSDLVSYNLYFGWYIPVTELSGWKLDAFHKKYPETPLGLSEYGAEAMPNLHSARPRRMDNTEEYQCVYHEKMLKVINAREYLWATHLWNMFDFAADARNQGGEPGMNHKGLVTFDRKTKKDSFYLYKAFWGKEKFVHIAGKRFANRTGESLKVKVYSNCAEISLLVGGKPFGTLKADKIFEFTVPFAEKAVIQAQCKECGLSDEAVFNKVSKPEPSYKLRRAGTNKSWEK